MRWLTLAMAVLACSSRSMAGLIFDGSMGPEEQGWSVGVSTLIPPYPFFSDGDVYDMNTLGVDALPPGNALHLWARDVGISVEAGFSLEFSLKVIDDTGGHNPFDAPIAFMAHYVFPIGDRSQMIYFDEDEIGWGDESDTFAIDTTDSFHTYMLTVDSTGQAQVFVDGILALTRTNFVTDGTIAFGDQTNDTGVDGHFQLRSIALVPTPPASLLIVLGLWRGRGRRAGWNRTSVAADGRR